MGKQIAQEMRRIGINVNFAPVVDVNNNIDNPEGGMHVVGFKTALTRTLNNYARKNNILKEKDVKGGA